MFTSPDASWAPQSPLPQSGLRRRLEFPSYPDSFALMKMWAKVIILVDRSVEQPTAKIYGDRQMAHSVKASITKGYASITGELPSVRQGNFGQPGFSGGDTTTFVNGDMITQTGVGNVPYIGPGGPGWGSIHVGGQVITQTGVGNVGKINGVPQPSTPAAAGGGEVHLTLRAR